jgi:hypothetical protein
MLVFLLLLPLGAAVTAAVTAAGIAAVTAAPAAASTTKKRNPNRLLDENYDALP